MQNGLLVVTAAATQDDAAGLARSAVRARLAASAQVHGPVRSFFWHLGELGEGEEWVVLLRTTADRYDELEFHLLGEHPWDNPEMFAVALERGSAAYLDWLTRSTAQS